MEQGPLLSSHERRRHLRRTFDNQVAREWKRYEGEPWRVIRRVLRERFLRRHLKPVRGAILELGPGPGRFTPILRSRPRTSVVAVDLSRESMLSARRRSRSGTRLAPIHWIQAAGEFLPLESRSVEGVVALGNVVGFASRDGPALLRELARVTKPSGLLVADFATPVGAIQEFFHVAARNRSLPRVLRHRKFYRVDEVLEPGIQPLAPDRLCPWEFKFYTAEEAHEALQRVGYEVLDTMSVGPITSMDDRLISVARRDARTWESLLAVEERAGRRPGVHETGDGFLVAAVQR